MDKGRVRRRMLQERQICERDEASSSMVRVEHGGALVRDGGDNGALV